MSTRATLLLHDMTNNQSYQIYRHSDGYPNDVLSDIRPFVFLENDIIEDMGRMVTAFMKAGVYAFQDTNEDSHNIKVHTMVGKDFSIEIKMGHIFEGIVPFEGELHGDEEFSYEFFVRDVGYSVEIAHIIVKEHGIKTEIIYQGKWHENLTINYDGGGHTVNHGSTILLEDKSISSTDNTISMMFDTPDNPPVRLISSQQLDPFSERVQKYLDFECPYARDVMAFFITNPNSGREDLDNSYSSIDERRTIDIAFGREGLTWLYLKGYLDVNFIGKFSPSNLGLDWYKIYSKVSK